MTSPIPPSAQALLAPLRDHPERTALFCDVDGTLAPIVARPEDASVPALTREVLISLYRRYALVGCISGRRATEARRLVGMGGLDYIGSHGLERLRPGAADAETLPSLDSHRAAVQAFASDAFTPELGRAGVRLERKHWIWAFHWREAADEASVRVALERVATAAAEQGLVPHWGRKVLEIRPPVAFDKGTALAAVLGEVDCEAVLYGGDDRTDLDVFRKLRELRATGEIRHCVCVGVTSQEGPPEIAGEADLVVDGPEGFRRLLAALLR